MSAEMLLSLNAEAGIDKTVLVQAYSAYRYDNSYSADCAASYTAHFASVSILDPLQADTPDNLSYWVRERGMRDLRLFTTTEPEGTWLDDPLKSFSEIYRQPHTTVRCWITGQVTGVHGNAGPRQPLHVWHLRPFVNARFVTDLLLQNGEHSRGSRMAFFSSADRRATDADAIAVNIHSLFRNADDDHDWSGG
jgi:hypothetical protein